MQNKQGIFIFYGRNKRKKGETARVSHLMLLMVVMVVRMQAFAFAKVAGWFLTFFG